MEQVQIKTFLNETKAKFKEFKKTCFSDFFLSLQRILQWIQAIDKTYILKYVEEESKFGVAVTINSVNVTIESKKHIDKIIKEYPNSNDIKTLLNLYVPVSEPPISLYLNNYRLHLLEILDLLSILKNTLLMFQGKINEGNHFKETTHFKVWENIDQSFKMVIHWLDTVNENILTSENIARKLTFNPFDENIKREAIQSQKLMYSLIIRNMKELKYDFYDITRLIIKNLDNMTINH